MSELVGNWILLPGSIWFSLSMPNLHVDLAEVTFIDSTGFSYLIQARKAAESFTMVPSDSVIRLVEMMGLDDFLDI